MTFDQWIKLQGLDDPSPRAVEQMRLAWEVGQQWRDHDFAKTLPYAHYLNPPDGGDVSILEQVYRMSYDAAAWRNQELKKASS